MLPVIALLAFTSTSARQVYRVQEPYEKTAQYFEELSIEERVERAERDRTLRRWAAQRDLRFSLRGGLRWSVPIDHGVGEISLGFCQRVTDDKVIQGNLSLGTGAVFIGEDGNIGPLRTIIDATADVTVRIGARRFYWGLGPIGRAVHVFEPRESTAAGGGAVLEFGLLLGDDRRIEVALRFHGGALRQRGQLDYWVAQGLSAGWHF